MKKIFALLTVFVMGLAIALAFSACADSDAEPPIEISVEPSAEQSVEPSIEPSIEPSEGSSQDPEGDSESPANGDAKALVVYFSVPDDRDNSYVEINGERLGNTQYMAYVIQENTGADIFRILPKNPYPTDHDALLEAAQEEIRTNARPEIDGAIEDFDSYDAVFVGYPNWNADMPYILYTFFETYDFSQKTIIPFNTHGGSGFSGTLETIASLEPGAAMLEGKSISRNSIEGAEQEIIDWLDGIGMLKAAD